jgi:hypothetical protein
VDAEASKPSLFSSVGYKLISASFIGLAQQMDKIAKTLLLTFTA